ncbi:diaminobutyrate--2-oxoglutarate transaminase [Acinetobacter pollinis]|uniref:diaminobutyrate--2-oxoglutarate transaminase n=1 Tax=Acinetobacter pollinis TaxID=2605270 RepID=UPI0018A2D0EA|nr:diaminobutyrate--2-oxoglutarate transaminase [Acinetobacter pollinis]MBF7690445.1 diaminobutyrate--2-oxoglutarate transaminase [Acinetobacter pollinis]MBF7692559.1 diaminobutyrate--2-oxoglutarate transaminase [Acinetobacter pollinis]MBF7697550.1 diaminobutyrate--2-oxoglutarate transaminase [Acinetobacter pollinis]MBF7699625.1 diaminobutyrate--2-oxoglutarate transaminase [Acinetobacter pollinis]
MSVNSVNPATNNSTNEYYLTRQSQMESNVRSYPRKLPLAIAKAQGCWVTDVEGKEYLDCLAGAGTLALGHNHPAVIQSIQDTLASGVPLHTLDLTTPLKDKFTETLLSHLPGGKEEYCLQFCGPSGADATEAAMKLAKTYTGRGAVVSFSGGYHGMTHGSLSVTGNLGAKNAVSNMMPGVQFLPYPHEYRCPLGLGGEAGVDALTYYFEQFIEDVESGVTKPAAVILEAIQGEGGVVVAPTKWLRKIREVTEKHGIVLILDEVQAGFSRSGKMFAFEHAGIEPDIIVMSKAVGGSLPLAVLGIKRKFDAWSPGAHTGTFRGNQLAMGTGLASLQVIKEQNLAQNAQERGDYIQAEIKKLAQEFPCIGNVRGRGLMIGVEIVDERLPADHMGSFPTDSKLTAAIQAACFNNQLLLEKGGRNGTVIRLLCPLIITQEETEELIKRFKKALAEALTSVRGA